MDLKTKIFDQVAAARTGQKTVNEATESILDLLSVAGQSELLKAFADYAQKRMWEDGDKDLSEFVDEFLRF